MTYDLVLGDRAYSSWSLRGWLLFEAFGLPKSLTMVEFSSKDVADQLASFFPARTVPTLRTPDGAILGDSLAIAEELASRHPEAGLWPADPFARATARALSAEMHSGFAALRTECPMNLRAAYSDFPVSEAVRADLRRLEVIWTHAREKCGGSGPWLCGEYSIADAMYAPVAARIAGYGLPVNSTAQDYVNAHLSDPAFRRWRAMSLAKGPDLPWYAMDHTQTPWPWSAPLTGTSAAHGPSENETCPYSGDPVSDYMELDGRIFGFCNPFCRDKTLPDPAAWPDFMEIYNAR